MDITSSNRYITPITKVHSTFDEAKKFYDEYGGISLFDDEKRLAIADLVHGTRNLIVGEPGIGKTELLKKIKDHLDGNRYSTELVSLRQADSISRIDAFLSTAGPKALLLDALDEIQSSRFPSVLKRIEEISTKYPDLPIYLSSRWIFVSKYAISFPEYRFITISPFTHDQVKEYLLAAGHSENDIDALWNRIMSFSHQTLVIQIPRYLFFLEDFLRKKGVDAAAAVSRNELFEYFIYSKLELEDERLNSEKRTIIKRVLEKLALTMEIYQTNVLSQDELITFFDELKSDLKLVALAQVTLEVFFDKSLLKNNVDAIEFDNTEFQEYLAAKEITRFPNPHRAAFSFAVDGNAQEIYPTWFNALTFLVDMQGDLLEQLVEFSGLRATQFKVVDEEFFTFLSRVDPRNVPLDVRRRLFSDSLAYHQRTRQWLPGKLSSALPSFFDSTLEGKLKFGTVDAEQETGTRRFVPLANIAYVVGYLLRRSVQIDRAYWRERLIAYSSDINSVLQRHALFALGELRDPSVLDELPNLMAADELVTRAFLSLCAEVDADNPKCIEYFCEAVSKDNFYGRYGISALKKPESIRKFLDKFNTDEDFRREFLDDTLLFRREDDVLIEHMDAVLDEELRELSKEALVQSVDYNVGHNAEHSWFLAGLWKLLRRDDPGFVTDIVGRINSRPDGRIGFHFASGLFAQVMEKEDVPAYIEAMLGAGEPYTAFDTMVRIKLSNREAADEIYEQGRNKLSENYRDWEERHSASTARSKEQDEKLLKKFQTQLEPEKNKFGNSVFRFYNENAERLDSLLSKEHRDRLVELITGTVFRFVDPAKHSLTITSEHGGTKSYTTSGSIRIFGDALRTAERLGIDITPYRQNIINFIPFAFGDELKTIFKLVKEIRPLEMQSVIEVYRDRASDLWRHETSNFIEAVEQYHVVDAVPILKELVKESACDRYTRRKALTVVDSLSSDAAFLSEIFHLYRDSKTDDERNLAYAANSLLVTSHGNADAIRWRLRQVGDRAAAFIRPVGVHSVGDLEEELHSKGFARPLLELKHRGYEQDYLELIDRAMSVWAKGNEFYAYAAYLWEITYSYFDNLKEARSYAPLRLLERKIIEIKDQEGANWLASRMAKLRRSYLGYLGRPRNVSAAIQIHNDARGYDDKKITNSDDLFRHLQDVLEVDLRRWIEGEGAYDLIRGEKVYEARKQEYEKLVQKTLKAQVENIFLRRGFQIEIIREPQLYDEKRTDLLVRYGFVGPIVVEVKLTSNTDLKGSRIDRSPSYKSMERYMEGYGASHGVLLVIDNTNAKNLSQIRGAFQRIPNVWVQAFDCNKGATASKSTRITNNRGKKGKAPRRNTNKR